LSSIKTFEKQDLNTTIVKTGDQTIDLLIDQYNRMINHVREEKLRLEGQGLFLEELLSVSPIGVIITDFDDHITDINPVAYQYLDREKDQLIGKPLTDLWDLDEDNKVSIRGFKNRKFKIHTNKVKYKGFYRKCVMIEDITTEILKSEKEAYGRVIRMMSHEVNNSTGAINSILQNLGDFLTSSVQDQIWTEAIDVAVERNKNLTQFVSNFASVLRIYPPQKSEILLSTLIQKTISTANHILQNKDIKIHIDISPPHESPLFIDPIQIEQVLINILKNAVEAIEESGSITITLSDHGHHLCVADTGSGITQEVIDHLNQTPFYSTKTQGQGIGLMLIREILNNHNARYNLRTEEHGVTRFEVWF
jgi:nitrogen fixation/metabolism regulation signal transduction histidine kinase